MNKSTESNCNKWLDLCRVLYNAALEERISAYEKYSKSISYNDQQNTLPILKKENPEYKFVDAQCLQDSLKRLDRAFQSFFRRVKKNKKSGFQRFKSKNRYNSFTLHQHSWKLMGRFLTVKNIGKFKLYPKNISEGNIKSIIIRRNSTGDWYVSFICDNVPKKEYQKTDKEIGIDVGIKSFCVDSDNNIFDNPEHFEQRQKYLRKIQRSLSRKDKDSKRRLKTKKLVAKTYEKIQNSRSDFLHKTSHYYVSNYRKIYVENLNVKEMIKNKKFSKSVYDVSWSTFFNFLTYKAEEAGREVIKVNPRNTSQVCSQCGSIVKKDLSIRTHNCPYCGIQLDRDFNASLNILQLGQSCQALNTQKSICLRT